MTTQQSFDIVSAACAACSAPLQDHQKIQQALHIMKGTLFSATEASKIGQGTPEDLDPKETK